MIPDENPTKEPAVTEAEWLTYNDVSGLLVEVCGGPRYQRAYHLFALACLEPLRPHLSDDRLTGALEVMERYAEGKSSEEELARSRWEARAALSEIRLG